MTEHRPPGSQHISDHLANERTFLAWVRTSVAIIGLGFVVSRFGLYLRSLASGGAEVSPTSSRSAVLGVVLVGLGAVTVVLALIRYFINWRAIERGSYRPARAFDLFLALFIAVAAVVMMAFLLTSSRL